MDIMLLILAEPLDKHGTTPVHITYPLFINVLIFAMLSEIFTHIVDKYVLQFKLSRYPGRVYKNEKKNKTGRLGFGCCGILRAEVWLFDV